jgi:restriction endonuclease Mrr
MGTSDRMTQKMKETREMPGTVFEIEADYCVPLLRLLAEIPGGQGSTQEIIDLFFEKYGQQIPPAHFDLTQKGEVHWHNKIAWVRYNLVRLGLMDAPARGVWRITQAGREWLAANPEATHVPKAGGAPPPTGRTRRSRSRSSQPPISALPGVTLEVLEQTRQYMPPEQFRQVWGGLYDQLLAEERAKAITPIDSKKLAATVLEHVRRIQNFLQGRGNDKPSSEELCDWIHFCYILELYREGNALWQFVHKDEVNAWQWERIRKVVAVCRARVGYG